MATFVSPFFFAIFCYSFSRLLSLFRHVSVEWRLSRFAVCDNLLKILSINRVLFGWEMFRVLAYFFVYWNFLLNPFHRNDNIFKHENASMCRCCVRVIWIGSVGEKKTWKTKNNFRLKTNVSFLFTYILLLHPANHPATTLVFLHFAHGCCFATKIHLKYRSWWKLLTPAGRWMAYEWKTEWMSARMLLGNLKCNAIWLVRVRRCMQMPMHRCMWIKASRLQLRNDRPQFTWKGNPFWRS